MDHILYYTIVMILACFAFDDVNAATCEIAQPLACFGNLDWETLMNLDPSEMDMESVCGVVTCIKNLDCDLSNDMADVAKLTDSLGPSCLGTSDPDPSVCSLVTFKNCIGDMMKADEEPSLENLKNACPVRKCLSDLLPTCKAELKTTMETILNSLKDVCQKGCEMEKISACFESIADMDDADMTKESCKKAKGAGECAEKLLPNCKGEFHDQLQNMSSIAQCCDGMLMLREKCFPDGSFKVFENKGDAFKMDSCKNVENAYSCVMAASRECAKRHSTPVFNDGKTIGKEALELCEERGYNLTISVETGRAIGSHGTFLQPSTPIMFGVMLVVITGFAK